MKKKKKSASGRLFYTFGSLFLIAVIAVCTMNFVKDGRAFQVPLLSATAGALDKQDNKAATKTSENYKTMKYNKTASKPAASSNSTQNKAASPAAVKAKTPAPVDP